MLNGEFKTTLLILICVLSTGLFTEEALSAPLEENAPQIRIVQTRQVGQQLTAAQLAVPRSVAGGLVPLDSLKTSNVVVDEVNLSGRIDGKELLLDIGFEAETKTSDEQMVVVQGNVVLSEFAEEKADCKLNYNTEFKAYFADWSKSGKHQFNGKFIARSVSPDNGLWRQVYLNVPAGNVQKLELVCDQPDLEVELPGAMRVEQRNENGQLIITAILNSNQPMQIRWKPQVDLADAKLVLSSQANTIVNVGVSQMQVDTLFDFQIMQGKVETLEFEVPDELSITSVDGVDIRTWKIEESDEEGTKLKIELSKPQERSYLLRINGEASVGRMPANITVPVIEPTGGIRASGYLAVGTNSALQLVVKQAMGVTQIDSGAFPHLRISGLLGQQERPIPTAKAFYYRYSGSRYMLAIDVDDIVPSYDVSERFVATVKEDDLVINTELELEVRDAPIRQLDIQIASGFVVASVDGDHVEDYQVSEGANRNEPTVVRAIFDKPLLGRSLIRLQLELGKGPLGQMQSIKAITVEGSKTHRGYVVIAAEAGIDIKDPTMENLRQVHTASVPLRVSQAQFAYRFREPDWGVDILANSKPAGIRAEVFHLQSIGESLAYGSAVINYIITGSPVDELKFRLPDGMDNVEFVGSDVRRWSKEDGVWVVKLTRKVIGDYNLAVTYTQQHGLDKDIQLGALKCEDAQTQTGYVVVTSHLDLKMKLMADEMGGSDGLLAIAIDELPVDYRLLTSSPILAAYKYVSEPHEALLGINPYERSGLLPVILDIIGHQTRLAVNTDGQVESVTTVRYKVKNTTGQFLSLAMPEESDVWSVYSVDSNEAGEVKSRLATSFDSKSGQLLVPLVRKVNPNDPSTIELEYGQVHDIKGIWRPKLNLKAPCSTVPVTYTEWQIVAPEGWSLFSAGGNMQAQPRGEDAGLWMVLRQIQQAWGYGLQRVFSNPLAIIIAGVTAVVLIVVFAIFMRKYLPNLVVIILLLMFLCTGLISYGSGHLEKPGSFQMLNYSQAVNADPDQAIAVRAVLVPSWRSSVSMGSIFMVLIIVGVFLAICVMRRKVSMLAIAAILACGLYFAAKFPPTWGAIKAIMTWGIPAAVSIWCLVIALKGRIKRVCIPAEAVKVPMIILIGLIGVCGVTAGNAYGMTATEQGVSITSVDCNLKAADDNMEIQYKLVFKAEDETCIRLINENAVLLSSAEPVENIEIKTQDGWHTIAVDKKGDYTIEATFLVPINQGDMGYSKGQYRLPLPMALKNSVTLSIPDTNVLIESDKAIHLSTKIEGESTVAQAMFAPGDLAGFSWKPKERQASQEETRFYAKDVGLAYITSGLVKVFHDVRLQIAQGQIDIVKLNIAEGETVTSVNAPEIGSWRFDPITQEVEARMAQPVTGVYNLTIETQSSSTSMPYDFQIHPLLIQGAVDQHSIMGIATDTSVYVNLDQYPTSMNTADYIRDSGDLSKKVNGLSQEQITRAYRFDSSDGIITGKVLAVQSELRSQEFARFNAEDERLVYNSQWVIDITKAGRFDIVLEIPEGYDIDTLSCNEVSHWDELTDTDSRKVRVHFKRKLSGSITLNLALSRPISQMPEKLTVPRVTLSEVLKHTGQLIIGSEQGVRLSVAMRQGVSEVNPGDLGQTGQGLLAFQLLRPDWQLDLQTELVQPRVNVQTLHVAKVTDGLVRHDHYLRYTLHNSGMKTFDLTLPKQATGVAITGSGIARREQISEGVWRVELADKVFDRPYLMRLTYETQYEQADGTVQLEQVVCKDADLQQGYTVVFATDRMEVSIESIDASIRASESRNIPKYFGAGDLSAAAMCYYSSSPESMLNIRAIRHSAAEQIGADVRRAEISSVITPSGQGIHRVLMTLSVGTRRNLQVMLPDGGVIWSLSVDGQATQPSIRTDSDGKEVLRIPLPQQNSTDVKLDMVYVADLPSDGKGSRAVKWSGVHKLKGARFDLPLKNITWQIFLPAGFSYDVLDGTLAVNKNTVSEQPFYQYSLQSYEQQITKTNYINDQRAQQQLELSRELAQQGRQTDARRALSIGYNYSQGNKALNEDIRVDLDNLLKQQAKIAIVNSRGRLRQQVSGTADGNGGLISVEGQDINFSQQQADRMENSLGQADNENLDLITQRIIQTQAAAEASVAQLQVTMPYTGKVLVLNSPLQVEPDSPMSVTIKAEPQKAKHFDASVYSGFGLFVSFLIIGGIIRIVSSRWCLMNSKLVAEKCPVESVEAEKAADQEQTEPVAEEESTEENSDNESDSDDSDDSDGPVSADELI